MWAWEAACWGLFSLTRAQVSSLNRLPLGFYFTDVVNDSFSREDTSSGRRTSRHRLPGCISGWAPSPWQERGGCSPHPAVGPGRAGLGFPGAPPTPPSERTSKWLWGTGSGTCRQPLPSGLMTSTCAQSFEALRLPAGGGRGKWGAEAGNGCKKGPAGLNWGGRAGPPPMPSLGLGAGFLGARGSRGRCPSPAD